MPVPWGNGTFRQVSDVIKAVQALGCQCRQTKSIITTPYGDKRFRYLYNPETKGRFDISDFSDNEYMAPSTVMAIERRLGISIDLD